MYNLAPFFYFQPRYWPILRPHMLNAISIPLMTYLKEPPSLTIQILPTPKNSSSIIKFSLTTTAHNALGFPSINSCIIAAGNKYLFLGSSPKLDCKLLYIKYYNKSFYHSQVKTYSQNKLSKYVLIQKSKNGFTGEILRNASEG